MLQLRNGKVDTCRNTQTVALSALGSHQHNPISSTHTIYCCSRSILQDGETLHIRRIDIAQTAFQSVNQYQGTAVGTKCTDTAYPKLGDILPWLATTLHGNHTGNTASQHIVEGCGRRLELVHIHSRDSTRNTDFSLFTHTDNYSFLQLHGRGLHLHDQIPFTFHDNMFVIVVTQIFKHNHIAFFCLYIKTSVCIGRSTDTRFVTQVYVYPDHRFIIQGGIQYNTRKSQRLTT